MTSIIYDYAAIAATMKDDGWLRKPKIAEAKAVSLMENVTICQRIPTKLSQIAFREIAKRRRIMLPIDKGDL